MPVNDLVLCRWIERIPGGTRENDGLETEHAGAAAVRLLRGKRAALVRLARCTQDCSTYHIKLCLAAAACLLCRGFKTVVVLCTQADCRGINDREQQTCVPAAFETGSFGSRLLSALCTP